ncbi:unnamed protein product [Rhizopus stolonifer]
MKLLLFTIISSNLAYYAIAQPIDGCLQTYNITDNSNCLSVATHFQITETELYAMNPDLHHTSDQDCDNLNVGEAYCVCITAPCPVMSNTVSSNTSSTLSQSITSSTSLADSSITTPSSANSSVSTSSPSASISSIIAHTALPSISSTERPLVVPTMIASTTPSIPGTSDAPFLKVSPSFAIVSIVLMAIGVLV